MKGRSQETDATACFECVGGRPEADTSSAGLSEASQNLGGRRRRQVLCPFIDGKNEDTADVSNVFKVSKLKVFWFGALVSTCPRISFKNEQRRKAARILLLPSKCCGKTRSGGRSSLLFPGTLCHNPTISLTPATPVGLLSSQLSRPMWEPAEHLLNFGDPGCPFQELLQHSEFCWRLGCICRFCSSANLQQLVSLPWVPSLCALKKSQPPLPMARFQPKTTHMAWVLGRPLSQVLLLAWLVRGQSLRRSWWEGGGYWQALSCSFLLSLAWSIWPQIFRTCCRLGP